jgi:CRP-like cAMP-binding protein
MIESKYLKDNVQNIQKLMAIPALKSFETENLGKLLRLSKIREYEDGEEIIKEGDLDPWIYFLLSGEATVQKDGESITMFGEMGSLFGEMSVIDNQSRSASVVAKGKTVCLAVDTTASYRLTSEDEAANFLLLLYSMFAEFISGRLRLTNEELIKAKKEIKQLKNKLKSK